MNDSKKKNLISSIIFIVLAIVLVVVMWQVLDSQNRSTLTYDDFLKQLENDEIYSVYFDGYYTVKVIYKNSTNYASAIAAGKQINVQRYYDEMFYAPSRAAFSEDVSLIKQNYSKISATIYYSNPDTVSIWDYAVPLLSLVALVVLVVIFFKQLGKQNNQNMQFSKSKARMSQNVKVRFTDVAGAEEEKEELQEIIDFLKNPKKFTELGARIPRGVLLVGPPGTGKTLFAKAVAGEAGVPFFSISGSDFVEMFVGVGASRVRDLFDAAKKNMPCIVFIDEIDAVGRQRGAGLGGGHDEREQTLNQLLVEMDGFETNTGIIIMAATNRADILDPALLRPGRFDRQIFVNRPDVKGREAILKVHSRNKPIASDVDFKIIARITAGFTGADLENLLNEAAILAVRAGRTAIMMADISEGINKVIMGPQKKSRLVTEPDKRITAYHEAGHAILAASLKYCDPVHEVTIIPRGAAAGYTMTRPDNDNNHVTKAKLLDDITMTLGGRVAEELVIENISSGASGDIKQITKTAHQMVTEWGMSEKLGPMFYGAEGEVFVGRSYQSQNAYSEEIAGLIDEEMHKIIDGCHAQATKILTEKINILHNMAKVLFEKETIRHEEVEMLMNGDSFENVVAYMEKEEERIATSHRKDNGKKGEDIFPV